MSDLKRETPSFWNAVTSVKQRAPDLVVVTLIGGGILWVLISDEALPRWMQVAGLAAIATLPLGYFTGQKVVSWLYNPRWVYVVDLDARVLDGGIYRLPPDEWREFDVLDDDEFINSTYDVTQLAPDLYVGKQVDLDDRTVVGTWRGTLDDRELTKALRSVHECRGMLQDDAQRGFILEASAFSIVRRATRNTTRTLVETFENGALPDQGEGLTKAIDDELADFGLDDFRDDVSDLVDDHDLDDLEHKSGFDFSEPERNGTEAAEVTADD